MTKPLQILGIVGSLRSRSFNKTLMLRAQSLAPSGLSIQVHDIADLPMFNQDLETPAFPDSVQRLHAAVRAADGILLAVPEYNHAPTAVLKNTLDWMSRPAGRHTAIGKPVAMIGTATGMAGTLRAQAALRPTLHVLGMFPLSGADCTIPHSGQHFDAEGELLGDSADLALGRTLDAFHQWIVRLQPRG